ncbi:unnamed protein product [Urochloa humidicola]
MAPSPAAVAIVAACDGNLRLLKETASKVNLREAKDAKGQNVLHFAAVKGYLEVCRFLIEYSCHHDAEPSSRMRQSEIRPRALRRSALYQTHQHRAPRANGQHLIRSSACAASVSLNEDHEDHYSIQEMNIETESVTECKCIQYIGKSHFLYMHRAR